MEKKILYNVLKAISNGESGHKQAPDGNYIKSLQELGLISIDWDIKLTVFGNEMYSWLRNQLEKW